MRKIVKKTNMVDNRTLKINYLCPTGLAVLQFEQRKP